MHSNFVTALNTLRSVVPANHERTHGYVPKVTGHPDGCHPGAGASLHATRPRSLKVVSDELAPRFLRHWYPRPLVYLRQRLGYVLRAGPRDEGVTAHKRRTVLYPLVGRYPLMGRFLNAVIRRPSLRLRGK